MNAKVSAYRRSELRGLDVTISALYHWSVARQLTPFSLRHWNLRNLTLQKECYLTNTRAFFRLRTALLCCRLPSLASSLGWLVGNNDLFMFKQVFRKTNKVYPHVGVVYVTSVLLNFLLMHSKIKHQPNIYM